MFTCKQPHRGISRQLCGSLTIFACCSCLLLSAATFWLVCSLSYLQLGPCSSDKNTHFKVKFTAQALLKLSKRCNLLGPRVSLLYFPSKPNICCWCYKWQHLIRLGSAQPLFVQLLAAGCFSSFPDIISAFTCCYFTLFSFFFPPAITNVASS